MERYNPNNPTDPVDRNIDSTYVESSSDSGVTWFIVGALVIAAGVLAYLYFGEDANTTAETSPPAIEAPADTGRASTPAAPADTAPAPAPAAPAPAPAPAPAAPPAPAPAP
jgi:hypothetical protein